MCAYDHWHNRPTLAALGHRLRSVPMLIVLIPFVVGIAIADRVVLPLWLVVTSLVLILIIARMVLHHGVVWFYAASAMLLFGYVMAELRHPLSPIPYDKRCDMVVLVDGEPQQRDGYRTATGRIEAWSQDDGWHRADSRVHLWLRSDSVDYGSRVVVRGELREHISRYADYDELMHRRGYVGGLGIADYNILALEHSDHTSLHHRALSKLNDNIGDSLSHATVEAMVVGSRRMLTPQLREAYSKSGLAHLMAVSGLHLGIVMMVIGAILMPLLLLPYGHIVRNVAIIVLVWLFAMVCGMSPSVVRAALMLSVLQLSLALSMRYDSLNTLCFTIFVMLIYRPDYLYDISFRLSVMTVLGIVLWAVPLMRRLPHIHWSVGWLQTTFIVGVVATLWSMPLVSSTFGNVPLIGIVVTPVAMLCSYMIVGCGIIALALPNVLSIYPTMAAEWWAALQNEIVLLAAAPRWAAVEYSLTEGAAGAIYILFGVITVVCWAFERKKRVTLQEYDDYR